MAKRPALVSIVGIAGIMSVGTPTSVSEASGGGLGGVEPLETVRVAGGLNRPVFVTHAPGDETRLYIVEQRGLIKVLDLQTGAVGPTPFLDIDAIVMGPGVPSDEHGLLGLAFHPDFASNGRFFVNYTNNAFDTVVARYLAQTPDLADPSSGSTILVIDQPQTNNNGGWIAFGPADGDLYIATGDGGGACDGSPGHTIGMGNAQDLTNNLLGKVLRIDVDGSSPYEIPPDNPFVGVAGDDEIWAYGLRNPWRNGFDPATGDLYIADVGQSAQEEINFQPGVSAGGENYGWRCFEGGVCSSASGCLTTPCGCNEVGLVFPIHAYPHSCIDGGFAVIGGSVYRGCEIPSLDGHYFYADYVCGKIWSLRFDGSTISDHVDRTGELSPSADGHAIDTIASFGVDALGELYIVDRSGTTDGEVFRIVPVTRSPNPDIDCDGAVGFGDVILLLAAWGDCGGECREDLDGDGTVGFADLLTLLAAWST